MYLNLPNLMRENPLERNAHQNFSNKANLTWKYKTIVIKVLLQEIGYVQRCYFTVKLDT